MFKIRQTYKTKNWFQNMDNRTLNFLHTGEDNYMRFLHMIDKCRLDRVALHPVMQKLGEGLPKQYLIKFEE